jgi:hypothetical protein
MTIAEYNAATPTERAIEDCATTMYEDVGRAEEYAHDGERLPKELKAAVYRAIAAKALSFAQYLEEHP